LLSCFLFQQLSAELEHLTSSFGQLKGAQARFRSCIEALDNLNSQNKDKENLIPLTASLYVTGKIQDVERVTIDVGTGYYISKVSLRVAEKEGRSW